MWRLCETTAGVTGTQLLVLVDFRPTDCAVGRLTSLTGIKGAYYLIASVHWLIIAICAVLACCLG